jgi:hypothetical protein
MADQHARREERIPQEERRAEQRRTASGRECAAQQQVAAPEAEARADQERDPETRQRVREEGRELGERVVERLGIGELRKAPAESGREPRRIERSIGLSPVVAIEQLRQEHRVVVAEQAARVGEEALEDGEVDANQSDSRRRGQYAVASVAAHH